MPTARSTKRMRLAVPLALCLALQGCALSSVLGSGTPARTFDLSIPAIPKAGARAPWQVVINQPSAVRAITTDRIMVKQGAEISYLAGAVWSDTLPRLLQARMVETLQNTGGFRAVGGTDDRISADVQIMTDIRAFELQVSGSETGASQRGLARVELFVKAVDAKTDRIVGSRLLVGEAVAHVDSVEGSVSALNAALDRVLGDFVAFARRVRPEGNPEI